MCICVWATCQGKGGKNMNVHGAATRNEPGETGRKRTKPEGLYVLLTHVGFILMLLGVWRVD